MNQDASGAVAGQDDFAVLAAFERGFKAVQAQSGLRLFGSRDT